jgi:integrase
MWYGRYELNGRLIRLNLLVKITGTPPVSRSLRDEGDTTFERSRAAAAAKLDSLIEETRSQQGSARLVERLYEIKTGEAIKSVKLDTMPDEWAKIARRREPDARYAAQCKSTLTRFAMFVRQENPKAEEMAHVTRSVARAFMDAEAKRGVTGKTWNDTLKLVRATFKYLLPAGGINPFADTPTKETETVFRIPFSPDELKAIMDVAREDEFIRPIMVAGMCTAMRRGDCCLLDWKDVDFEKRFITVKTSKTGQTVSIPIFPMLEEEMRKQHTSSGLQPLSPQHREGLKREGYVFPDQAKMYLDNPDGITWRVKRILALALSANGISKGENTPGVEAKPKKVLERVSDDETRQRVLEYIATLTNPDKRERMQRVFEHYLDGSKVCEVANNTGASKGSISGYLNEIEQATGCLIVRGRADKNSISSLIKRDNGLLAGVTKTIEDLRQRGIVVRKIDVDVQELGAWCQSHDRVMDGDARATYVTEKMQA